MGGLVGRRGAGLLPGEQGPPPLPLLPAGEKWKRELLVVICSEAQLVSPPAKHNIRIKLNEIRLPQTSSTCAHCRRSFKIAPSLVSKGFYKS